MESIEPADVAELIAALHAGGMARESIRKTRATLAMVLDFGGVQPNPARDSAVKLPRDDRAEVNPPTAAHVAAVWRIIAPAYRLPLLVLDATGMRVGELEALLWGDIDEPERRWRVSRTVAKTGQARWVPVLSRCSMRSSISCRVRIVTLRRRCSLRSALDRLRTALTRACKAAGVPAFSPHDLRHRRATLWHLDGRPIVEAAAWLGHSPQEHLKTYAHATLTDRAELDHAEMLGRDRSTLPPVLSPK